MREKAEWAENISLNQEIGADVDSCYDRGPVTAHLFLAFQTQEIIPGPE